MQNYQEFAKEKPPSGEFSPEHHDMQQKIKNQTFPYRISKDITFNPGQCLGSRLNQPRYSIFRTLWEPPNDSLNEITLRYWTRLTTFGVYTPLGFCIFLGFYTPLGFCIILGVYIRLGFCILLGLYILLGFYTVFNGKDFSV